MSKEKIQILIVDDEFAGRNIIKNLLPDALKISYEIHEANSVANALKIIHQQNIDLLFLDIQMPEQNGFELLRQLPIINFEVIFVTAFNNYAIQAFKFNAVDYLLKPIDIEEFKNSITKALLNIREKINHSETFNSLLEVFPQKTANTKVAVHINQKVIFIHTSSISHINAINNYSEIVNFNSEKFVTPHLLKEYEEYLKENNCFVRISRSTIINVNYIDSYTKNNPCFIIMKNGEQFEISRRKKAEILTVLSTI